jgi:hypothetical protein
MTQTADTSWLGRLGEDGYVASLEYVQLGSKRANEVTAHLGLSPGFLEVVNQGFKQLEAARLREIQARQPQLDVARKSARTADVAFALASRRKLVLCPFSGIWTQTDRTVGSEAYWVSHGQRTCLVLQFCTINHPGADSAFAFPGEGVVLYFPALVPEAELRRRLTYLFAAMSRHSQVLQTHLGADPGERTVAAVELRAPHFGHYVWNALSAWGHLLPQHAARIDFFVSWRDNRFIGPVTGIYPEVGDRELLVAREESDFLRILCERRAFAVFPKDTYLTEDLARRVASYARRVCSSAPLEDIDRLRARCQVLVLFALRTGNRAWLNQEQGFVELARALCSKVPRCGFIIDGMNRDTTRGWTHSLMSDSDEVPLAASIGRAISEFAPCMSTVGASMAESLVASELCDLYIAPAGSGLAKYKWISNKPGVLISNSSVLDQRNDQGWAIRVFEYNREKIIKSRFLAPSAVCDVPAPQRPASHHANFELDWPPILAEAEVLLRGLNVEFL